MHSAISPARLERQVVRAADPEVVQVAFAPGLAQQRRRPLLHDPKAERLERGHEIGELDPATHLVEADPGEGLALLGLVGQADHEGLVAALQILEPGDVLDRQLDLR
jgi:hypothetical protein